MKKKALQIIQNKQGLTLMELIVCMLVMVIFTGCIVAIMNPALRNYVETVEYSDAMTITNNVVDEITNELLFAKKIYTETDGAGVDSDIIGENIVKFEKYAGITTLEIKDDGYLYKNGKQVFDAMYYKGCKLHAVFAHAGTANIYTVELTITNKNGATIPKTFTVRPIYQD